jgi:hypothetical protein
MCTMTYVVNYQVRFDCDLVLGPADIRQGSYYRTRSYSAYNAILKPRTVHVKATCIIVRISLFQAGCTLSLAYTIVIQ